jgi:hypothetical protein
MPATDLLAITDFESLRDFLEDERDSNFLGYSFDDLTFTYVAEELGFKPEEANGVKAIHQLRPLSGRQPWGIFFVEFESKRLIVLRHRRHRRQSKIQHLFHTPQRIGHLGEALAISPKRNCVEMTTA